MTRIEASTNSTLSAWTSSRFAEMGMPSLQEFMTMLDNCRAKPRQFTRSKSPRPRQFQGLEPILGRGVPAFDMDVRRLGVFQAVKKEPERARTQNRRHVGLVRSLRSALLLGLHPHIFPWRIAQRFQLAVARLAGGDLLRRLRGQPGEPVRPPGARRLLGLCDPIVELAFRRPVRPVLVFRLA